MAGKTTYRVGVDIGGTFTDIVLLGSDGTIHTQKISSSVDNYARAIVEGLGQVLQHSDIAPLSSFHICRLLRRAVLWSADGFSPLHSIGSALRDQLILIAVAP